MKKLLLLKFFLMFYVLSYAQAPSYAVQYYHDAGYPGTARPSSSSVSSTSGWNQLMDGGLNANAWSDAVAIPFAFDFYGQPVTHLKASANFLVTFDTATAQLPSVNTNLPTSTLPDKTIAAFWDEFTASPPIGTSDRVYTREYGTAPNRQFWVFWYSYEIGNPVMSYAYAGVALEESTNKIYVVDLYSASANLTSTVGVQLNPTTAVQFGDSLTGLDNNSSSVSGVDYYEFMPRIMSPTDAALTALVSPMDGSCYGASESVTVTITNTGTGPISNVPVTVNVTGATTQTLTGTYTGTLAPGASVNLTLGQLNMSAAGSYTFAASAQLAGDGDPNNDNLPAITITNSVVTAFPHIEDFESASTGSPGTLPAGWTMEPATGYRWQVDNSTTSSSSTGPDSDHTLGTSAGKYVYTEASSGSNGDSTLLISPCINLSSLASPSLDFWYHMYGSTMGELHVDVWNGSSWDRGVFSLIGQQQTDETDPWKKAIVDLSAYAGDVIKVRFRGIRSTSFYGDMAVDDIKIYQKPAVDAALISFLSPLTEGCYSANEQVVVNLFNSGIQPISNVPVTLNVTGAATPAPLTATYTGTIAPGDTATLILGNINMSTGGVYDFEAIAGLTSDGDATNDTIRTSYTVISPLTPSLAVVDFETFTGSNLASVSDWREGDGLMPDGTTSSWTSSSTTQEAHFGTSTAKLYFSSFSASNTEWIVGPKFTVLPGTHLFFDAAVTTSSNTAQALMGTNDTVHIMVSADCGVTFKSFATIDASDNLPNTLTPFDIDLSVLAGQDVIVAFYAVAGGSTPATSYDFHLDNLLVKELTPTDAGVAGLISPLTYGCYSGTENVVLDIHNFGTGALSSVPAGAVITKPDGTTQTLSGTLNTNLASGANATLNIGQVNMLAPGTYNFRVYTNVTSDGDLNNDTLSIDIEVAPTVALPIGPVDFEAFTGSNLESAHPGWTEADGVTPMGTTSSWTSSSTSQESHFGTSTAKLYFSSFSGTNTDWIIGPKFTASGRTRLKFNAALTSSSGTNPAMMGSGDTLFIMISNDCGTTFKRLDIITESDTLPNTLKAFDYDLSALAGLDLIIAFYGYAGPTAPGTSYDLHLDDILIKDVVPNDVGIVDLRTATTGCGLSATENVCVTVENYGTASQSNIPVRFRLNNGTVVNETFAGPLAPGDTASYCFTAKADLSTPGVYTVSAFTALAADTLYMNDTMAVQVESFVSPNTPTVNNVTRCGPGAITLSATAQAGNTIRWYDSPSSTLPLDTGATFSDTISATTTYYAAAVSAGGSEMVGKTTLGSDGSYLDTDPGRGLIFDAISPFMLQYVHVYPTGTGTITIRILDLNNNVLLTGPTVNITGSGNDKVQVPVNLQVPAGTYKIGMVSTGITGLRRDFSGVSFPYTAPSGVVSITSGVYSTSPISTYYWFYEWGISTGCESQRVPVTASVSSSIPVTAAVTQDTVCVGTAVTFSATSSNPNYTFTWSRAGMNDTVAASFTETPTVTTQYIVTAVDGNCNATDTLTVVVNPASVGGTIAVASDTVCLGSDVTLNLNGYTGSVQWQRLNSAGTWVNSTATGATTDELEIVPTQNVTYRAMVTSGVCSTTYSDTVSLIVTNPQLIAAMGDTICGTGQVTLTANANAGSQLKWYADSTGGPALHTGATYTPNVTATDTFYVAAVTGGGSETVGKPSTLGANGTNTGGGLIFDVLQPFVLESVVIYYSGTTSRSVTIELQNSSSTTLQSANYNLPATSGTMTAFTVPLGFNVPAGTGLKLVQGTNVPLYRDYTASVVNFPYVSPSGNVTITNGTLSGYYYFFYNWVISSGCESGRLPVVATVTSAPAPAITATGSSLTRNFSTTATGVATYNWNFGDGNNSSAATPSHTYAVAGTYTVSLTVTYANGCSAMDTLQVSVVTGIKEDLAASVKLYPNPTSGKVFLELEKAEQVTVAVHNMQGQVVRKVRTNGEAKVVLDLEGLATGSYLIKVDNGKQMFTKKVLYQNF
ncbi:MAG: choice-of-anchor J domain-containing protein [Hymenobacteraceae bacterium]|nr:choice-of-anchor J domain-containing protein [Hymenobacteraceae bacterium]MDX5511167.1 choice-of-anchor J domain-containing protein [Hymenobacteraceae bacterium]